MLCTRPNLGTDQALGKLDFALKAAQRLHRGETFLIDCLGIGQRKFVAEVRSRRGIGPLAIIRYPFVLDNRFHRYPILWQHLMKSELKARRRGKCDKHFIDGTAVRVHVHRGRVQLDSRLG